MGNLSDNCRAISGSRSTTPTISHPLILWICDACASAILPHPTIATLSMSCVLPATAKVNSQRLRRRHSRRPTQKRLCLLVAVPRALPEGVPREPVVHRRQLSFRPAGVLLPESAERVADGVRQIDRSEAPDIPLVESQELAAGRQVIVDDVEDLSIDAVLQACQ